MRTEEQIFLLGVTMDEERPTGHLDCDGFFPTWFHSSPCRDLSAEGRGYGFAQWSTDRAFGLQDRGGRGIDLSIALRDFRDYSLIAKPDSMFVAWA